MKHVFSDISTIAHIWANKTQDSARNSGNFYFEGDTIYSYGHHFPIAKHIEFDGTSAVLFTERTYSNTTAKHISVVRQACRHLNIIYCYRPDATHDENFEWWATQAEKVVAHLKNARKPEIYLQELRRIEDTVNKYVLFFNLFIPPVLLQLFSISNKEQYKKYLAEKQELIEKQEREREIAAQKAFKKSLQRWLHGEGHRLYENPGQDYLRISKDGDYVETSQAVKVPMSIAKKTWELIKNNKLNVGDTILGYRVNEIGETINIGCHTFPTDYLLKFGEKNFNNQTASV